MGNRLITLSANKAQKEIQDYAYRQEHAKDLGAVLISLEREMTHRPPV
jgi:hypothetical protein